jgi:hypothetical protein
MDFPLFHFDWLNDRFLIAVIAILHVLINHGLAVGFIPFVVRMETRALQEGGPDRVLDPHWDRLAYRLMFVAFVITTTVGAMTGVGIWFSAALVSPTSIGSLIRVFYGAWFIEWLVFVTEVVLILLYFLTWKSSNRSVQAKVRHIRLGWFLSFFSCITMAIIVSILGFMMDPGNWNTEHSLINGFTNPIYLPQLAFRTPTAMVMAGVFGMLLITLFARNDIGLRAQALRLAGRWVLFWTPLSVLGAVFYYNAMPEAMTANMSTAVGTMQFEEYYELLKWFIIGAASLALVVGLAATAIPKQLRTWMVVVPVITAFGFLGIFERVREFIRKPYIIGGYMYSNLLVEEDYPIYQRDGVLAHATYTTTPVVTDDNLVEAGRNVFLLTCSRCHTTHGINSIVTVFEKMYGEGKPLDPGSMAAYIQNMHNGRTYMPPFPGNERELEALAAYIRDVQTTGTPLEGAQAEGVVVNPAHTSAAVSALIIERAQAAQDSAAANLQAAVKP